MNRMWFLAGMAVGVLNGAVSGDVIIVVSGGSIQVAIDAATDGDTIVVEPGTYLETIDFQGKAITVQGSGAASSTIDGNGAGPVVTCATAESPDARLIGFTITGGSAGEGGGMYISNGAAPNVTNCIFLANTANGGGGGMYSSITAGAATVTDCAFVDNTANAGAGMHNEGATPLVKGCSFAGNQANDNGGAMYNRFNSPTIVGCVFMENTSILGSGGAIHNFEGSSPLISNCLFVDNVAVVGGGGIHNMEGCSPTVMNCTFRDNQAIDALSTGGAMYNRYESSPLVINCTFVGNTAALGGAIYNFHFSNTVVVNSILWGNSLGQVFDQIALTTISFSNIEGGWNGPGSHRINAPPLLDGDLRPMSGSPCIDAGHNWGVSPDTTDVDDDGDVRELTPFDLDGNPRFADDPATKDTGCGDYLSVDMGAYEFQGVPARNPIYLGDLDADGVVGIVDFLALLANWGPCVEDCCLADLDLDENVGIADFLLLLGNWG